MTVHHSLTILRTAAGGAPAAGFPVSNPPGYSFQFGGNAARMHQYGHIWLNQDPPQIKIEIEIVSPNFTFANDGTTNDGTLAFFTSDVPGIKNQFRDLGVFGPPTLDTATYTKLTFVAFNPPGVGDQWQLYYYQLNVNDPNGRAVSWDPIIVNQP